MSTLILPNRTGDGINEQIELSSHVVITGANGSGKTRLGVWIEQQHQASRATHRISAQKALAIPEFAQLKNLEQAEKELIFGRSDQHATIERKVLDRWGGDPYGFLLSDYEKLLSLLFAKSAERDRKHTEDTRSAHQYVQVPEAPLETIAAVWEGIMPHRAISFSDGKVLVRKDSEPNYHGKEMSDGERVALYLLGQCLCAPTGSMIIVDEPELHLHKSLMDKLWNKIEELISDKTIVYITHDLDFAASRSDAKQLWIKSYNGNTSWEWEEVPHSSSLPDSLLLEVLGSRKRIAFCEGEHGSLDSTVYQLLYPDRHLIPRGSCTNVIEATRALRANQALHHLDAVGIIDADFREDAELAAFRNHGVYATGVAEVENLLCVQGVLRIVARHLGHNEDDTVAAAKDMVIGALIQEIDVQISSLAERRIQYRLRAFSKTAHNQIGIEQALQEAFDGIRVGEIYAQCEGLVRAAIDGGNLDKVLQIYNRKSLSSRLSSILGLANGEYPKLVVRLMKGPERDHLVAAMCAHMPSIESPTPQT